VRDDGHGRATAGLDSQSNRRDSEPRPMAMGGRCRATIRPLPHRLPERDGHMGARLHLVRRNHTFPPVRTTKQTSTLVRKREANTHLTATGSGHGWPPDQRAARLPGEGDNEKARQIKTPCGLRFLSPCQLRSHGLLELDFQKLDGWNPQKKIPTEKALPTQQMRCLAIVISPARTISIPKGGAERRSTKGATGNIRTGAEGDNPIRSH
jgi:hypothetical protein